METFGDWIRNLTGYFLFMSILSNLLPEKKYEKYIRLFSGMVLILLVLQPLTGKISVEERIARYYQSFVFQYQADDLKEKILGVEDQRLNQMIAQYEKAVGEDISQMAQDSDWKVDECRVKIDSEEGSESFGKVTEVVLELSRDTGKKAGRLEPVEKIRIEALEEQDSTPVGQDSTEVRNLQKKIASYYSLEEQNVKVRIMGEKR